MNHRSMAMSNQGHSLFSFFVTFLLVFRCQTAMGRFYAGAAVLYRLQASFANTIRRVGHRCRIEPHCASLTRTRPSPPCLLVQTAYFAGSSPSEKCARAIEVRRRCLAAFMLMVFRLKDGEHEVSDLTAAGIVTEAEGETLMKIDDPIERYGRRSTPFNPQLRPTTGLPSHLARSVRALADQGLPHARVRHPRRARR
jgi:hypothetical protein